MAFKGNPVTVASNAATPLASAKNLPISVAFFNNSAVTVYLGDSGVTSATGAPVPAGTWSPGFDLSDGETAYARAASATADVRVIITGAE